MNVYRVFIIFMIWGVFQLTLCDCIHVTVAIGAGPAQVYAVDLPAKPYAGQTVAIDLK